MHVELDNIGLAGFMQCVNCIYRPQKLWNARIGLRARVETCNIAHSSCEWKPLDAVVLQMENETKKRFLGLCRKLTSLSCISRIVSSTSRLRPFFAAGSTNSGSPTGMFSCSRGGGSTLRVLLTPTGVGKRSSLSLRSMSDGSDTGKNVRLCCAAMLIKIFFPDFLGISGHSREGFTRFFPPRT